MKINIVSAFNRNCGIGQYTEHLTQSLHQKGATVQAFRKDGPDDHMFHSYPYRSFRSWQHRIAPYFLKRAIAGEEADMWHADYVSSFQAVSHVQKSAPHVVTVHDAIPFHHRGNAFDHWIYRRQMKQAVRQARYLITVSDTAREDLILQAGVAREKVVSIPNGIDMSQFAIKAPMPKNEVFTIRYLGGLGAPHKNVAMLLHTAKLLEEEGLTFSLELGGFVPKRFFLKDLAKKLELRSVTFSGFIPEEEKARFLAGADLFVFPSLMEGFGFPPMEAMASGTAVLASNIPVFEELLADAALLVDPIPALFARGIKDFMRSGSLKSELEQKGQEHVRKYSWDKAADKTYELYEEALTS